MKYNKRILKIIERNLVEGRNQKETCAIVGIAEDTFYNWKKDKKEFSELLEAVDEKKWERIRHMLPAAADKLVNGFDIDVVEQVGTSSGNDDAGNPKMKIKEVRKTKKHFPPNAAFVQFVMKNLDEKKFSDRQEMKHSGSIEHKVSSTKFSIKKRGD